MWQRPTLVLLALLLATTWAGRAGANVTVPSKPGGPSPNNYLAVTKNLNEATFVVITYLDGTKAIVADTEWLDKLKILIASAGGKPDSYCFCINYPTATFANKDREIASLEVPHLKKFRFGGDGGTGDYVVDDKIAKQVVALLMQKHELAMSFAKSQLLPPPPKKLEVNLPRGQSTPSTPPKGG